MRGKRAVYLLAAICIFLIPLASASVYLGNLSGSIQETYSPGERIKGWINISFQEQLLNENISSNFQSVSSNILSFLDTNHADYECAPFDCLANYLPSNPQETKNFHASYRQEALVSFVLNGRIQDISSLSFSVSATNERSCAAPLKIDLLDDNGIEWKSKKTGEEYSCIYESGKGCFNTESATTEVYIRSIPYCEKIGLLQSEKFRIGAWLRKDSSSQSPVDNLEMALYDSNYDKLVSCSLQEPTAIGGEVYCNVSYSNSQTQEYYICVKAKTQTATKYLIKKENPDAEPCGFFAVPGQQEEYHDYYIFAAAAKFENIGSFNFNQQEYESGSSGNLASYVKDYVAEKYGNNCTKAEGCGIPLSIKFYSPVNLTIFNLSLEYSSSAGGISERRIYDATRQPAKVSSGFLKLDLASLSINAPLQHGNYTLILYLNDNAILSRKIYVTNVLIISDVYPLEVAAAVPAKFTAIISNATKNITSYRWDFGDSIIETTSKPEVIHAYSSIGSYTLRLEASDEAGLTGSKEFAITVGSPKEIANATIKKYKLRIVNITAQITGMPSWYKEQVKEKINLDSMNSELAVLERKFNSASGDAAYILVMADLTKLKVPYAVKESGKGSMPFFSNEQEIKLNYLEEIGAGSYDSGKEEEHKKKISAWNQKNVEMNLDFSYISAYYDAQVEAAASVFKLKLKPLTEEYKNKENYVIIGKPDVVFQEAGRTKEFLDATGLVFESLEEREINFAVLESVSLDEIIIYISPEFKQLGEIIPTPVITCNNNKKCEPEKGETWKNCRSDCAAWARAIIYIAVLLFVAFIVYIIMQEWYKKRYESHLFKNRNELFNLINFISNALNQGLEKNEIEKRLKQQGWGSEQVIYAYKKVRGERTGMWEIPIFRSSEKKEMQREIQKRQAQEQRY